MFTGIKHMYYCCLVYKAGEYGYFNFRSSGNFYTLTKVKCNCPEIRTCEIRKVFEQNNNIQIFKEDKMFKIICL